MIYGKSKQPFMTFQPFSFIRRELQIFALLLLLPATAYSQILLDDTFADGSRSIQNLPNESAWYVSSSGSWTTTPGSMSLAMGSTAVLGVTSFAPNSSSPISLSVGDTLTASIKFTFNGVASPNTSGGFRIGLFDLSDSTLSPKWPTGDLSGNSGEGSGVAGYALFQSMGTSFNNSNPMNLEKRTTTSDSSLLGTSGDYTSLGAGPGNTSAFSGFAAGTQYVLQLSVTRSNSTTLVISSTWQNATNSNSSMTWSVTDASATSFNFDTIGFRPSAASSTASTIAFNEVTIDYVSAGAPPNIDVDPQDTSAYVGQTAFFSVTADGSNPLTYQWYFNSTTPIDGATNSLLTLTDVQVTNSGSYSCLVSNAFGSTNSATANLTVTVPVAPTILSQPQSVTVLPGANASFSVSADGSQPLSYQWYFNTNTLISGADGPTLTVDNVQATNVGFYSVVVENLAGSTNSVFAQLTENTNPVAPAIVSQPTSVITVAGGTASFSASVSGTTPIYYQWLKNGAALGGATASTLVLTNVQNTDAGSYALYASNGVGAVMSSNAMLTVTVASTLPNSEFNLTGFGGGTTGGGIIAETDPAYRKVTNALDLANALIAAYKTAGAVKVIEITTNMSLGWNEIGSNVQNLASTPFRSHNPPQLHPVLLQTGVSLIDIKPRSGLTIFSANGVTIKHATFNIKGTANIIVRNLKFDEMWEWDEATKGQYDKNDWDFIDLGNGGAVDNVWIDHCTFTKTYDGILDTKAGCSAITISWCKYTGDDGATNTNSWVWQQINSLESNRTSYAFYNFLRNNGFSTTDIVTIIQGHDKTHLAGQNDLDPNNATITMTFHHLWLENVWDRCVPRLRAGNVHDYNLYADITGALAAKNLRNQRAAAMTVANQNTLNNTYDFDPPLNGAISTEGGAVLVEKSVYIDCLTPLRNNQTDPSDPEYTGKILALDSIYEMNGAYFRGNSTDPGGTNTFGPLQAPIIPFSWNLSGNQLPYSYTMDDPSQLQNIVAEGAGAGVVNWDKTNWLATTYAPTAPQITAEPQDQTAAPGGSATFTVVANGSAYLSYQWYFNTNTPIPGATNSSFTLTAAQSTNAGIYSVIVTNSAGAAPSSGAVLNVNYASPQISAATLNAGSITLTVTGSSGPDYILQVSTDLMNWQDLYTNHAPTPPFTWNDAAGLNQRFYRVKLSQ
jgi:pectate lyase